MEMIWEFAGQYTQQGDIGRVPDRVIAGAAEWPKKPEVLVDALVTAGWLDRYEGPEPYRLTIHDWPEHCEQSVIKWLEYNKKQFLPIYRVSLETRKRKSRDSHPSREAKAEAKAEAEFGFSEKTTKPEVSQALGPVEVRGPAISDEHFRELMACFLSLGVAVSETDMRICAAGWVALGTPDRIAALALAKKNNAGPWSASAERYIPRPWNYLRDRQWERISVAPARTKPQGKGDLAQQQASEIFRQNEAKRGLL